MFLNPPVGFVGKKGFQKFINEIPKLKCELTKENYNKLLANKVAFFGTVPTIPNALRRIKEPDEVNFGGGFDKMSRVLNDIGREYGNEAWLEASGRFKEGAVIISEITNVIVNYLTGESDGTNELPGLFTGVMKIMTDGFVLLGR
ncbi:hypothetical protein OBV_35060 [Oscillibacter valericigenes Sjm18-20]|nr:hypothetical protein OBV_08400 [Oscillibacter valericigenes Sjm18-20]BAL00705.1 hypothetical protein OBV_35060 [Oscillibacter valericigenes Sjm18-20]